MSTASDNALKDIVRELRHLNRTLDTINSNIVGIAQEHAPKAAERSISIPGEDETNV